MIGRTNCGAGGGGIPKLPDFTYTGEYTQVILDEEYWAIRFLTGGTFTLNSASTNVDIFCVGGGGGGTSVAGGGGGYTKTFSNVVCEKGKAYSVIVGAGGKGNASKATDGSASSFGLNSADGGKGASGQEVGSSVGGKGGSGGSSGGNAGGIGGSDGADGSGTEGTPGIGQGTTTREFGESGKTLYSGGGSTGSAGRSDGGGGAAFNADSANMNGLTNTGGGGGQGKYASGGIRGAGGDGGSGIVVIRAHKAA